MDCRVLKKLTLSASFLLLAFTFVHCNSDSKAMYCRVTCDTLFSSGSSLPPYASAWQCKKACDEKLDDARCASIFTSAAICFHESCEGTFGTIPSPKVCERACGPQINTFFGCKPDPTLSSRKPYINMETAKILPATEIESSASSAPASAAQ